MIKLSSSSSSSWSFNNQQAMYSRLQESNECCEQQQYESTDCVGDRIITYTDNISTISSWNQEYKCLRKAFFVFIVSFQLNLIQKAAGIVHQFFHLYPTFVGWLYLITKVKRLLISFRDSVKGQEQQTTHSWIRGLHSCPTMNDTIRDNNNKEKNHTDFKSNAFLSKCIKDKLRNLHLNEISLQERLRALQCGEHSKRKLKKVVHSDKSSTSSSSIGLQKKVYEDNVTSSDSKHTPTDDKRNAVAPTSHLKVINNYLIPQYDERRDDINNSSSWGYFVDCVSSDECDGLPLEVNDMMKLRQALSNDYGQFVDLIE